jgi:predicted Fe-Mo cluster-binding NifX family protein
VIKISSQEFKLAVPSSHPGGLNALVNRRFGRCDFFTIVTIVQNAIKEVVIIPNPGNNAMGGAGPVAVHAIVNEKVQAVAGGDYGPNAMSALTQAGVHVKGYPANRVNLTVKELVDLFIKDDLPSISQSNVPMHSGMH